MHMRSVLLSLFISTFPFLYFTSYFVVHILYVYGFLHLLEVTSKLHI